MNLAQIPLEKKQSPEPALLRFWRAAYRRYRRPLAEGVGFFVPEFPVPLLSPCFVTGDRAVFLRANPGLSHFNEVLELGHGQREPAPAGFRLDKQFYLGERRIAARALPAGLAARELPLADAASGEELWSLLRDGFPRDAPFLRGLLPFLAGLDADFRTVFLSEAGQAAGVVSVGVAGGVALVLNAVVPTSQRGRGFSAALADTAEDLAVRLGAGEAFYWTEHPFLGRHAELVRHYRIYSRSTV